VIGAQVRNAGTLPTVKALQISSRIQKKQTTPERAQQKLQTFAASTMVMAPSSSTPHLYKLPI
jgi:hypothetical protein